MKKIKDFNDADDMLPEYNFDYSKARLNRFAKSQVVVLEADVAKIFRTSDSVNKILRAVITAMPKKEVNQKIAY